MNEVGFDNSGQDRGRGGDGRGDRPLPVTVRTLSGHTHHDTVRASDRIRDVTVESVRIFVARGELAEGDYSLTLPRLGDAELDPTGTIGEVGVVRGDVLVLVSRAPQVDG
ncbi:hypothetical protein [Pseudonocardia sp. TRM90224]|uniref:hypothetical protein n=1 Tax=Pseudonocardia sp. TRM90224 TaxID=2812678 RepID=UPI001E53A7FF|nr:hypothetical protein [Pseudonocardia sp. TRM90224]